MLIVLTLTLLPTTAQESGRTLKPNYRKIARLTAQPDGSWYLDSLTARFDRCDTSLTVDHLRCLYYSGAVSLVTAQQGYRATWLRFGSMARSTGAAWWRYQMLLVAAWSSGDGSRRHPLHVVGSDDGALLADDFGMPLWVKPKGRSKILVAPSAPAGR